MTIKRLEILYNMNITCMLLSGIGMFLFCPIWGGSFLIGLVAMSLFALGADTTGDKLIEAQAKEHYRIAGVPLEEKALSPMEEWDREFDQWRSNERI